MNRNTPTSYPYPETMTAADWLPDCEHSHPTLHNPLPGEWKLSTGKGTGAGLFGPDRYWLTCTHRMGGLNRCGAEGALIEATHIEEAIYNHLLVDIGLAVLEPVDPDSF